MLIRIIDQQLADHKVLFEGEVEHIPSMYDTIVINDGDELWWVKKIAWMMGKGAPNSVDIFVTEA